MAKPILIVRIPKPERFIPNSDFKEMEDLLQQKVPDYNIILIISLVEDIVFEVFYEKDYTELKFEELKQLIKDSL